MRLSSLWLFLLLPFGMLAQPPKGNSEYLFPLRPGEQNFLAGTMGELRGAHFHAGLDIKTGGRIGLPVYATQDGYISRMQVSAGGYGHALYMTHPDGNISVYAHLNLFEKGLEEYLRDNQYEKESYEIRLYPKKDQFYFERGAVIGYSGNTGSSLGPHLHFEIRDRNHKFLNPMEFGFTEIKDNIPPILKSVSLVTLDETSRINGAFGRYFFDVSRAGSSYGLRTHLNLSGKIGVEVYQYDNQNGTYSRNGTPELVMLLNGDTVFHQLKERMSFSENRNILVHYDYPTYRTKRRKYNKLYVSDGNELEIYQTKNTGTSFEDGKPSLLKILLRDDHNNLSTFESAVNSGRIVHPMRPAIKNYEIYENHLQFVSLDSSARVFYGYQNRTISPYLQHKDQYYYLWDIRDGLPDTITSGSTRIKPQFYAAIPSGYEFSFYNGDFDLRSGPGTLFDTLYLRFEKEIDKNGREIFGFKNYTTPINDRMRITLKPRNVYGEKSAVFSVSGSALNYIGGDRQDDGSYVFETRDLVHYTIDYDTIPPVITPFSWSPTNLKIRIDDRQSGIKQYRATINGKFLLMRYERKNKLLMAQPKDPNENITGEFILEVEDFLGNKTEIRRQL